MDFDVAALGQWSPPEEMLVEAEATVAYAVATNDGHPLHVSGKLASPVFAVVPARPAFAWAISRVTPPEALLRVLHLAHDLRIARSIVPGMLLATTAAAVGIHTRPSGTVVVVRSRTHQAGELVNEQHMSLFFRGLTGGPSGGEAAPDHRLAAEVRASEPLASVTQEIDANQTYRYADASGDHLPIHLDEAVAKSVGLPGIIVHGLCSMAFVGRAVVETGGEGDPGRLCRLAVRFSRPVLPGSRIGTRIWELSKGDGDRASFAFETAGQDGGVVLKDGLGLFRRFAVQGSAAEWCAVQR